MFYVFKNNQQWGPYSAEELNGYISAGNFSLDDLVWAADQATWVPLGKIQGDPTLQHTQPSNNIESDHAIKTESKDSSIICPNEMCIKRNNPEECVECEFRTTVLKDKATNSKLPKFTVRTERDIIGHWMEAKFTNYKKYKRFGWLLSIFPLVILYFILIEFGGEATVSLKDTAARRFSIYCLIFSLLILAFHLIQFGLAIFWILPDVKKKTNRHITGRFIFWFFLHVLICAGTAMLFSKIGGEGWVWYASLFFFVFLAPSIWWYPYCLLARCPYPNGIYLEYWTHGKDSGGWEYNDNLYSKRIWDNGQLVFWKQWGRTEEEFYKVEECWVGEQRSLQQFGYNPDGKSNSPLTRTPLVYRLGFDERKNAFAWTIFKKKAADTVTDQI